MSHLEDQDIDDLRDAALAANLEQQRVAMFSQVPNTYWSTIPGAGNPRAQLMVDLNALKNATLRDGTIPLRRWLKNAVDLAGGTETEQVFLEKLRRLDTHELGRFGADAQALGALLSDWKDGAIKNASQHPLSTKIGVQATNDSLMFVERAANAGALPSAIVAALAQRLEPALLALAEKNGLAVQSEMVLQRLVRGAAQFVEPRAWRMRLARCEATVCRVEVHEDGNWKALGTGFLIGPDWVLTNRHVVESALANPASLGAVRCRFDYFVNENGQPLSDGVVFAATPSWLVADSPHSKADELGDANGLAANADELDFAIIQLAKPAGTLPVGADDPALRGRTRGWLSLPEPNAPTQLSDGMDLFILQHPSTAPLKLAFGHVSRLLPHRIRYDTATESGSSGSPCFDAQLRLVAIHHAGDPYFGQLGIYNQGIPIQLIADRCRAKEVALPPPPAN